MVSCLFFTFFIAYFIMIVKKCVEVNEKYDEKYLKMYYSRKETGFYRRLEKND